MPEKLTITTEFSVFDSINALSGEDHQLLSLAKDAALRAYAPYSGFNVGAAVLLENGEIITGNNQENAAYPSGTCAERVAMFYAASRFPGVKFKSLAITAKMQEKVINQPVPPCGSCRQVLAEYENKNHGSLIKVIMAGEDGKVFISQSVSQLLPLTFTASQIKKEK